MKRIWLDWTRQYRLCWLTGALLWIAIAGLSWTYAKTTGRPYLATMVTWDEWAVAILLLPRLGNFMAMGLGMMTRASRVNTAMTNVMYGASAQSVAHQIEEDLAGQPKPSKPGLGSLLAAASAVIFALDLLVRGLFGLGWQPFY